MSTVTSINELLKDEHVALTEIFSILNSERAALEKSDMDALGQTQIDKLEAIEKLRNICNRKLELLQIQQLPASQEGWVLLIQQIGNPILELSSQWESNHELLTNCAEQNGINGHIIASSKQHNSQLLELLFGTVISDQPQQ